MIDLLPVRDSDSKPALICRNEAAAPLPRLSLRILNILVSYLFTESCYLDSCTELSSGTAHRNLDPHGDLMAMNRYQVMSDHECSKGHSLDPDSPIIDWRNCRTASLAWLIKG